MKPLRRVTRAYEQTLDVGETFARGLKPGDVVCLYGDLGAGKTAFVKGMARGLGISPAAVHSPTFTLMNVYKGRLPLYHFDLYRITAGDLAGIGYEEFFYGQGITAVEWSERLEELLPADRWQVTLTHGGEDRRVIVLLHRGQRRKP
jgi:tRNA threonylcarbamoyladenosine biosynthesis protein TsaE